MSSKKHRTGLVGTIVVALLALSGLAWAGGPHQFGDIAGSPFADHIDEIAGAGCASGFNDGTFRPRDATTRGQFAFWTANCGARVMELTPSTTLDQYGEVAITTQTLRTPGVAQHLGYLVVAGSVGFSTTDAAACPCAVQAVVDVESDLGLDPATGGAVPPAADELGSAGVTLPVHGVVAVPTDAEVDITLRASLLDTDVASVTTSWRITVQYVPFRLPTVGGA